MAPAGLAGGLWCATMNDLTLLDHFVVGVWAARPDPHLSQLRRSAKEARDRVKISLASIQSSLLLLAEIERSNSSRPIALPLPEGPLLETAALRRDDRKKETRSQPIWWDIYPAVPKAIRLGEIEAANKRQAIEKAAKRFQQDPAILVVVRRL
jgi:hypothetical protein